LGWEAFPDAFDMHIRVLLAWAVPKVGTELEHGESVLEHLLPEFRIIFPILLCFGRQIKKHHDPHNAIFIQSHFHSGSFGYKTLFAVPSKHFASEAVVRCAPTIRGLLSPSKMTSTTARLSSFRLTIGVSWEKSSPRFTISTTKESAKGRYGSMMSSARQ